MEMRSAPRIGYEIEIGDDDRFLHPVVVDDRIELTEKLEADGIDGSADAGQ